MINQILFLFCSIIMSCTNNNFKIIGTVSQCNTSSIDTSQLIGVINKKYAKINYNLGSYGKVEKKVLGQSTEGGVIIAYYHTKELKKVITTSYGETGKAVTEYYFSKDSLLYACKIRYFYDKPIYIEGSKIDSMQKNIYYFSKNQLIKWLDNSMKSANPNSNEYQVEWKRLLESVDEIKKNLGK